MHEHIGVAEVSERLGITRQRLHVIRQTYADFPQPEAQLSAGPVWHGADIDAWLAQHSVRPSGVRATDCVCAGCGRPRRAAELADRNGDRLPCDCGAINVSYSRTVHEVSIATDSIRYAGEFALPEPGWREQWARIQKQRNRLDQIVTGPIDQPILLEHRDGLLRLFQEIFHLKDWIKNDPNCLVPLADVESAVNASLALRLAADLANASKHLTLLPVQPPGTRGRGARVDQLTRADRAKVSANGSGLARVSYLVTADGQNYDASSIADQAIEDWRNAIVAWGLNP